MESRGYQENLTEERAVEIETCCRARRKSERSFNCQWPLEIR